MVKGQKEHGREGRLFGDGRPWDAHAEVDRLWKEKLKKKKKKKKKRNLARLVRDDLRIEQHRAATEKLVARLEAELLEEAGEEDENYETKRIGVEWRSSTSTTRTESHSTMTPTSTRGPTSRRTCATCRSTRWWRHCGL
jgi:hypothetical protein